MTNRTVLTQAFLLASFSLHPHPAGTHFSTLPPCQTTTARDGLKLCLPRALVVAALIRIKDMLQIFSVIHVCIFSIMLQSHKRKAERRFPFDRIAKNTNESAYIRK
jgi:hypothetical protein